MLSPHLNKTMTRTVIALALCTSIVACSDTTIGTKSFEESQSFTVPNIAGNLATGFVFTLPTFSVPIDLAEQAGYSDGDFDFVTSVKVREIVLEIAQDSTDPIVDRIEDGNPDSFEFVSAMSISLSAEVGGVPTVVPIADLPMNDPQIASNPDSLSLTVNRNEDIRDLIEGDNVELLIQLTGSIPPDNVEVDADIRFRVGIGFR